MTCTAGRGRGRARTGIGAAAVAIALSAALAGAPAKAGAQDADSSRRLVLGDLYRELRDASPRAAAARALARAVEARIASARRPPDPELQLGFMNYALPELEPMDPLGMTELQLMQMVPTAGKLGLAGRAAEARSDAAAERAADIAWEVRSEGAMIFYELYAADRSLEIARATLRLLHDILGTAEAMYRVGDGRQADVLRAQVEIARMTEDTIRMHAMRVGMAARLDALRDRPAAGRAPDPALPLLPASVPALDSLLALADAYRPMLRAGEAEVRAAGADARLARREIWPDLRLGVAYGQRGSEMGTERMGSLMIGASVPVFARSRQLRMREETNAMRRMAEADLAGMRAETRGRVVAAHAELQRARRLAALYRNTVIPQAEATVASAHAAYRVGSVDFMTLLDDRMTVNRYRQELASLEAAEGKAWAELEMLTGRQLFDPFVVARDAAAGAAGGIR
ncbi:MAG TPA: TolC family protein [Gemmatimonadaceae bacterium]